MYFFKKIKKLVIGKKDNWVFNPRSHFVKGTGFIILGKKFEQSNS